MKRPDEITFKRGTVDGLHYAIYLSAAPADPEKWHTRLVYWDNDGNVVEEYRGIVSRDLPLTGVSVRRPGQPKSLPREQVKWSQRLS